jgi:hypothetical protein
MSETTFYICNASGEYLSQSGGFTHILADACAFDSHEAALRRGRIAVEEIGISVGVKEVKP